MKFASFLNLVWVINSSNAFSIQSQNRFCTGLYGSQSSDEVVLQKAFSVGTLVEFTAKNDKLHVGKILNVEHKSSGGARYEIMSHEGDKYNIADKAVNFAMPISPNDEKKLPQIFDEFATALEEPESELLKDLDMSVELLEMAWEETLEDESHELTPKSLIDLVHSHTASAIETYKAWKLLRGNFSHVFFKEIKDHGKVVAFKAKAMKAVEAAKQTFCRNPENAESDLCWV